MYSVVLVRISDLLRVTLMVRLAGMQRPEAIHHSNLEVRMSTGSELIVTPRISVEDKCYHSGQHQLPDEYLGQRFNSEQSNQSTNADQRRWCNRPAFSLLTLACCCHIPGCCPKWRAGWRVDGPSKIVPGKVSVFITLLSI